MEHGVRTIHHSVPISTLSRRSILGSVWCTMQSCVGQTYYHCDSLSFWRSQKKIMFKISQGNLLCQSFLNQCQYQLQQNSRDIIWKSFVPGSFLVTAFSRWWCHTRWPEHSWGPGERDQPESFYNWNMELGFIPGLSRLGLKSVYTIIFVKPKTWWSFPLWDVGILIIDNMFVFELCIRARNKYYSNLLRPPAASDFVN